MLNFECRRCGECCKRYYIISLPEEVEVQAKFKGLSKEEFIEKHMQLFLQFFPAEYSKEKIMVSSSMVPRRILEKLEGHLGKVPDFFIALLIISTASFHSLGIPAYFFLSFAGKERRM